MFAVVAVESTYQNFMSKKQTKHIIKKKLDHHTLNREPIEENFDCLEDSSAKGGNKPDTKEHLEAPKSA